MAANSHQPIRHRRVNVSVSLIKKIADEILKMDGVSGVVITGDTIKVLIESDEFAPQILSIKKQGVKIVTEVTGKFQAL